MQHANERLVLAAAVRHVVDALSVASEACIQAGTFALGDQLVDLELEVLNLHCEILELGRKNPQLRRLPPPAAGDPQQSLPF
jgi:hypothetical protein